MYMNLQYFGGRGSGGGKGGGVKATPKEIGEYENAEEYFADEVNKWEKSLTDGEIEALTEYTAGDEGTYDIINDYLWNSTTRDKEYVEEQTELLDSAISKFTLDEDIVVYRGADGVGLDLTKGSEITFKGYGSTSTDIEAALVHSDPYSDDFYVEQPTLFKITVPKGQGHAAYVAKYGVAPEESEVLLRRNAKLKITGTSEYQGRTFVTATYI